MITEFNVAPVAGFSGTPMSWAKRLSTIVKSNILQLELNITVESLHDMTYAVTGNKLSLSLIREQGELPSIIKLDKDRHITLNEKDLSTNKLVLKVTGKKNMNTKSQKAEIITRREEGTTTVIVEMTINIENLTGFMLPEEAVVKTVVQKMKEIDE